MPVLEESWHGQVKFHPSSAAQWKQFGGSTNVPVKSLMARDFKGVSGSV